MGLDPRARTCSNFALVAGGEFPDYRSYSDYQVCDAQRYYEARQGSHQANNVSGSHRLALLTNTSGADRSNKSELSSNQDTNRRLSSYIQPSHQRLSTT